MREPATSPPRGVRPGATCARWRPAMRLAAALALAATTASAQTHTSRPPRDDDAFLTQPTDVADAPELKTPTMFLRPSQATAAAQFAFAREMEARGATRRARRAYAALVHHWHESPEAADAQLGVARLHEGAGRMLRAFSEYQYAVEHFAGRFRYESVLERQFAIANQLRADLRKGFFGFGREANVDDVVALFRKLVRNAPAWSQSPECYLLMGITYEDAQRFDEAVEPYETLATRFPGHALAADAMFRAARCRYELARRTPRDERTLRNALSALAAVRRDFPRHPELAQVGAWTDALRERLTRMHFERAAFYDRIRRNPAAAVVAYRDFLRMFPKAVEAPKADARIAALLPHTAPAPSPSPERKDAP